MKSTRHPALRTCGVLTVAPFAFALAGCSGTGQQSVSAQASAPPAAGETAPAKQASLTPFQGMIPSTPSNRQCSLDGINGQPAGNAGAVASGSAVVFGGWAGNGQGQTADQFVFVLKGAQDSFSAPLTTGVERPDVAKVWNSEGMTKSGYNISVALTGVAAGTYSLFIADPANPAADCDLHRTLSVQ